MDEENWIEWIEMAKEQYETRYFWLFKVAVAVFAGEYKKAQEGMKILKDKSLKSTSGASLFQLFFFDAFIDVAIARDDLHDSNKGKQRHKARAYKSSLEKLRLFGKTAPENVDNKISLIEAELAVLKNGRRKEMTSCPVAIMKFRQSIEQAHRQRFVHEEALANERYAIALLEWGETSQALEYFERAKKIYSDGWGAPTKVTRLINIVKDRTGITMK